MYWRPETAGAWRGFWADVQAASDVPLPDLTAPDDLPAPWTEHWRAPDLAVSQTCSFPLRTALRDQVTYVGTFDFGLGTADMPCPPGHYRSVYVQQNPDPPEGALRFALNGFDSQSGWAGTSLASADSSGDVTFIRTGSHAASMAAVAEGRADQAALDAVTWRLLQRYAPQAAQVTVVGHTDPTPGLPLICAKGRDAAPLRAALAHVCGLSAWIGHPDLGGLQGFVVLDEADYFGLPVPTPPDEFRIT